MSKVLSVFRDRIVFDCGKKLYSWHQQDCCEQHYLDFTDLSIDDFEGLQFKLSSSGDFFERVDGFGIRLLPLNGLPISVPGYGSNKGYYSSDLDLVLEENGKETIFNISECQKQEND